MIEKPEIPCCLIISGHDPSGGAGIQADIETMASMGAHAITLITALTAQDTLNVKQVEPVSPSFLAEQAGTLLSDIKPAAVKIGLIPDVTTTEIVHDILQSLPDVPIVIDPVIWAGGGASLQSEETREAVMTLLFPMATVITPNAPEARKLARNADTLDGCGYSLLDSGCEYVLITGGHGAGDQVENKLYGNNRCLETYHWPRLPHEYHGSGCTLASGIAGLLSHGHEPHSAIREAQQYTWDVLNNAYQTGQGQLQPHRFYWVNKNK